MSEKLKDSGERHAENAGANHLEVLTEMSGKFDANKAKRQVESDKPKKPEASAEPTHLEVITKKPERESVELTPKEAADEYLSLLDELSQDFSYPFYSNSNGEKRKGQQHYAANITTELGRKYSDNPHYRWRGYVGTEAGTEDGTMLRIASADCILANEIGWRNEGREAEEKARQINEGIDKEISKLDTDYAKKGRLGKFLGRRKYEKAKKELEKSKSSGGVEVQSHRRYNANIAKELAISYNERGDYDGIGHGEAENESRNRRFFGYDDPERAKKVERAIELRQKYEAEWTKKQ